jgi:23S rRNA pseudouridine1911/1915/1917 synthase
VETIELTFTKLESIRIDKFLAEELSYLSRSEISKIIENKNLKVNGVISKKSLKLNTGDLITIDIPEPQTSELIPEKMDLDIIYEDDDIIVIDKKQGVVVHPGAGNWNNTLVNGLLEYCNDLQGIGGILRPGVVHRIDKDTSGIIIFAKNQNAINNISNQFKHHTNIRKYLLIIRGIPEKDEGRIETFITRDPNNRLKFTSKLNKGKIAITNYKTIEKFNHFSLIEATLETGRTHQIRVHFSDMNHPLIGDPLYGYGIKNYSFLPTDIYSKIKQLKGQLLHAKYLEIDHPTTQKRISFKSEPHKDFLDFLNIIKNIN